MTVVFFLRQGPWGGKTVAKIVPRQFWPRGNREVLNGVGADGVGVKFPIFSVKRMAVVCSCPHSHQPHEERPRQTDVSLGPLGRGCSADSMLGALGCRKKGVLRDGGLST